MTEHVGQDEIRVEIVAHVIIRISVIASEVIGILHRCDIGIGLENAKGLIQDAAIGYVVQRVAPGVVGGESEARGKTAL